MPLIIPPIELQNLSYHIPNTHLKLQNIRYSFSQGCYGIIGDNGLGKTTLLKIISGMLAPQSGMVISSANRYYMAQQARASKGQSVARVLGIFEQLSALARIEQGNAMPEDFSLLDQNWNFKQDALGYFAKLGFDRVDFNQDFNDLSGGEQTKVLLVKAFLSQAHWLLLDEPTNHLDAKGRACFIELLKKAHQGVILVSHDRALLEQVDALIELSPIGVHYYGGNYSLYKAQKQAHQQGVELAHEHAQKQLKKAQLSKQRNREKLEQRSSKGKKQRKSGSIDKLWANSMKGKSEQTQARNKGQADKMLDQAQTALAEIAQQRIHQETIKVSLPQTRVPASKIVLDIQDLCFSYPGGSLLLDHFSLRIAGPERVAIQGPNGCGKSTLAQLIMGQLHALSGSLKLGVSHYTYLDQNASLLDPEKTLLEAVLEKNQDFTTQDAHSALAQFLFPNKKAHKKIADLSGGEKIRAALVLCLLAKQAPQLIILDEPSNHLDLSSIEALEAILQSYQGAMMIISHDQHFIDQLKVDRCICLPSGYCCP